MKALATLEVTVRIADAERFRLFVWELRQLCAAMRLVDDPFTEQLEHLIDRLTDGGDDEHEAE